MLSFIFERRIEMSIKDIEELLGEESTPICDNFWILSILLLILFNNDKKAETIVNVYINGDKVGE